MSRLNYKVCDSERYQNYDKSYERGNRNRERVIDVPKNVTKIKTIGKIIVSKFKQYGYDKNYLVKLQQYFNEVAEMANKGILYENEYLKLKDRIKQELKPTRNNIEVEESLDQIPRIGMFLYVCAVISNVYSNKEFWEEDLKDHYKWLLDFNTRAGGSYITNNMLNYVRRSAK